MVVVVDRSQRVKEIGKELEGIPWAKNAIIKYNFQFL